MSKLRALLACLMLLTLPLQGLAAFTPAAPCMDAGMVHGGHGDGAATGEHQHQSHAPVAPEGGGSGGHSCCHHVCPALHGVFSLSGTAAPDTVVSRVALLATLFIPDLPQRPPRA